MFSRDFHIEEEITMKKNTMTSLLLVITFLIFQTVNAQSIKEVSFSGGAPLNTYNPSITVPLLAEAFKRNGILFHASYRPSLRSLKLSNSGVFDGELHRVYNFHQVSKGKYANLLRVESQLLSVSVAAFAIRPLHLSSWKDLRGLKVAYYRGRKNITNILDQVLEADNIIRVQDDEHAFALLVANRVDVVVTTSNQGGKITKNTAAFSHVIEVGKLEESKIYAFMHNQHQQLAQKIAVTLEQMKADGTYTSIVRDARIRWMGQ